MEESAEDNSIWNQSLHLPETLEEMERLLFRQFDYFYKEGISGVKVDVQGLMGVISSPEGTPVSCRLLP